MFYGGQNFTTATTNVEIRYEHVTGLNRFPPSVQWLRTRSNGRCLFVVVIRRKYRTISHIPCYSTKYRPTFTILFTIWFGPWCLCLFNMNANLNVSQHRVTVLFNFNASAACDDWAMLTFLWRRWETDDFAETCENLWDFYLNIQIEYLQIAPLFEVGVETFLCQKLDLMF